MVDHRERIGGVVCHPSLSDVRSDREDSADATTAELAQPRFKDTSRRRITSAQSFNSSADLTQSQLTTEGIVCGHEGGPSFPRGHPRQSPYLPRALTAGQPTT